MAPPVHFPTRHSGKKSKYSWPGGVCICPSPLNFIVHFVTTTQHLCCHLYTIAKNILRVILRHYLYIYSLNLNFIPDERRTDVKLLFVRDEKCDKKLYFPPSLGIERQPSRTVNALTLSFGPDVSRVRHSGEEDEEESGGGGFDLHFRHQRSTISVRLRCRLCLGLLLDDGEDAADCGRTPLF